MKSFLIFLSVSILLSSCQTDKNRVFDEFIDIKEGSWSRDFVPTLSFDIVDTAIAYHLVYNVRNDLNYPFYNLYLDTEIRDSSKVIDSFMKEIYLFNDEGKPYGESNSFISNSLGDIFTGRYLAKQYVKFPHPGTYTAHIKQYMREQDPLPSILAIGLRIEKATNP